MANELSLQVSLTYTPSAANQVKIDPPTFTKTVDMTGPDHVQGTQVFADADEALVINDIGTAGYCLIKNLDSTNEVTIGGSDTGADNDNLPFKLKAGEFCLFRANGTITCRSASGATVQYWVFED
jgi:hypothetical protein